MDWYFNKKAFMEWIKEEVPAPLNNHFTYDLISNLVDYLTQEVKFSALGYRTLLNRLSDLLPDTDYEELEQFIDWR